jgi:hypothetical protein
MLSGDILKPYDPELQARILMHEVFTDTAGLQFLSDQR